MSEKLSVPNIHYNNGNFLETELLTLEEIVLEKKIT